MGIPNNKIDNIKELCSQNTRDVGELIFYSAVEECRTNVELLNKGDIKTYNKSVKEYFLDYKQ